MIILANYTYLCDPYLWQVLTQRLPWEAVSDIGVISGKSQHVTHKFAHAYHLVPTAVSLSRRRPPLPAELFSTTLGHILEHCWAYEPIDRPSISQLVLALLNDDPSSLHNHDCVLGPPQGVRSESPPPILYHDRDTFTQTCDFSVFRDGDEPLVSRTKTPIASRPIDPPLFSPPMLMPSDHRGIFEMRTPVTSASSTTGATPFMDSLALTPSSQYSSGPASRDEPSLFEHPLRPGPTPLPAAGRQPYVKSIQKHREVSNPIWPRTPVSTLAFCVT